MKHSLRRTFITRSAIQTTALGAGFLFAMAGTSHADSPEVMLSAANTAPKCATPGKLQAFLKARNPKLEAKFERIAQVYAKIGKELGVRHDYVFFQMMADTGSLSFKGGRARLVKAEQNNFAGLGAVGSAEAGESFPDIETGVRAHFQHVMLYAGQQIDNPVAERTKKVQDWNILASWQTGLGGPVTFEEMAKKWSSPTSVYPSLIEGHAAAFRQQFCANDEPQDEVPVAQQRPRGQDLAKQAPEVAKAEGLDRRSALGAGGVAKPQPSLNIINREPPAETPAPPQRVAAVAIPKAAPPAAPARPVQPVAAPSAAATALPKSALQPNGPVPGGKCRVWTASYGGNRGVIVRWMKDGIMNFTVIDVNEGKESKEAQSFIGGYTKDGALVGTFQTQAQALEKAFEYCPEG